MPPLPPAHGSTVLIRQRRWRVERVLIDHDVVRVDVTGRDRRRTFLSPFDRVVTLGMRGRPRWIRGQQARARLAGLLAGTHDARGVVSALRAAVDVLPYQLEPALALQAGVRRVLVADDVGLGKTIQAGIVVAEQLWREPDARILIIAPRGLRAQWVEELVRRFSLPCQAADRAGLDAIARDRAFGDNPWDRSGIWIGSLDYLKQPHVLAGLPFRPWDLVVVDEAHDACGDSARYRACAAIARRARQLLLLTATPHSGDDLRFRRLIGLGALGRADRPTTVFRRTRASLQLGDTRVVRRHEVTLSRQEADALAGLAAFEQAVLRQGSDTRRAAALLVLSIFRKRALSTMQALLRSLERRLSWLDSDAAGAGAATWVQPSFAFDDERDDDVSESDARALMADIGLTATAERRWLLRLIELAALGCATERKVRRVAALVTRAREPVVIFTEFRDSLRVVSRVVASTVPHAVLHGGQDAAERQRALARFAAGDAIALVATDVASQGLNLQARARWVINLELPWNPMRLEQRAGRVDRIGQTRRAHVTLVVARHPAETGLLSRLARRVLAARRALGTDVLVSTLPGDAAIRSHLVGGGPEPAIDDVSTGTVARVSRAWVRCGQTAAREIAWRRRLLLMWRAEPGRLAAGARAGWTRLRHLRQIAHAPVLLIFDVTVSDARGSVVLRHVVAVRCRTPDARGGARPEDVEAARGTAVALVTSATRRLSRRIAIRAGRSRATEAALLRHARASGGGERQPGLFDRRVARAAEATQRRLEDLDADARARIGQGDPARLTVERPVLVLTLGGGR